MLLVDDRQRQIVEHDIGREQGVRADENVDFASRQAFEQVFARAAFFPPGQ